LRLLGGEVSVTAGATIGRSVIYFVYKMHLAPRARQNLKAFWAWLAEREQWFYADLPMVKDVRWYYSVVGDVYMLECWSAFDDEAAFGDYRNKLAELKKDEDWESTRTSQDEWWEFLESRLVTDPPVPVGFSRES
jgi:hypothetical protein